MNRALAWVVVLFMGLALYFQATEPFAGTRVGYAGRLLGPLSILLIALSLVSHRGRGVLRVVGISLAVAALILVLAGRFG
jgi:hypothetical protein